MKPWNIKLAGRVDTRFIDSQVLRGNPLGDAAERPLLAYLPPGYDDTTIRYPTIFVIQGLTGQLDMWRNRAAFRPNIFELADALFADATVPPAILIFVDAWTSLGGSQFLNSPATGQYLDYLCDEVVSFVDDNFRTLASADHRGIAGKSSGGYGAMVVPMLRPGVFGALATHAGDALFDLCYLPDLAAATRALRDRYDGSFDNFWRDFRSRPAFTQPSDAALLNAYCMAACYSAEPDGAILHPLDPSTGRLRESVWDRWLALDPVRMAPRHAEALRSLHGIYIDAGKSDEYFLDLGAAAFSAELDKLGIAHAFELFEGKHGAIEYRYPLAWRYLAERLRPAGETEPLLGGHRSAHSDQSSGTPTLKQPRRLILETDGASRGNPGLAGAGIIIKDTSGHRLESIKSFLGVMTNNQAEYHALIEGLEAVKRHQPETVTVRMDSELVVKQMNGQYRVRNPEILALYVRAQEAVSALPHVTFVHVLRERNPGADKLANMAIDSRMVQGRGTSHD